MSDNKSITTKVSKTIDGFLRNGLHISAATKDTVYLYSTDKEILATMDLFVYENKDPEYCIFVHSIPQLQKFSRANDFCKELYEQVVNNPAQQQQTTNKASFNKSDMQKMWKDMRAYKSIEEEQKFLKSLIGKLLERKCPIDLIQRMFYCFEKPSEKHNFDEHFTVLNTVNKLVEYKTPRTTKWFFTGKKNSVGKFMPVDEESKQMFDKVKTALKKQNQNVK